MKNISSEVFNRLMENISFENTGFEEIVSADSYYNEFQASFHIDFDQSENLIIDDFGYKSSKGWVQLEPTAEQLKVMTSLISNRADELHKQAENARYDIGGAFTDEDYAHFSSLIYS